MKKHLNGYFVISVLLALVYGCTKSSEPYSNGVNHAVGMTNSRMWLDTSWGYAYGDTLEGENHFEWPEPFVHYNPDTTFSLAAINGFSIRLGSNVLTYRSTDSINKIVVFDSIITGSLSATLTYYYGHDSITFAYKRVYGFNDTDMQYYVANTFLHTL